MQRPDGGYDDNPQWRASKTATAPSASGQRRQRPGNRIAGCLLWGIAGAIGIALAAVVAVGAGIAGWSAGVELARQGGTSTAAAEVRLQCDRLIAELESGNQQLLRARIDFLRAQRPLPTCLIAILPTATALHSRSRPTESPQPSATSAVVAPEATIAIVTATSPPTATPSAPIEYDLDGLLSDAQSDISAQDYSSAIDTLDAIIAIDPAFQSDSVRGLYFEALTAQALTLFRTFKLSEAIVLTNRAEGFGDIGELAYERTIASTYLDALRLKLISPGESVRLFSTIAYTYGHSNYMNGQILSELQEAHRNYADTYALQGNACQALEQYDAALALNPVVSNVSRVITMEKRNQIAASCPARAQVQPQQTSSTRVGGVPPTRVAPVAVGVRPSPMPGGQSG